MPKKLSALLRSGYQPSQSARVGQAPVRPRARAVSKKKWGKSKGRR